MKHMASSSSSSYLSAHFNSNFDYIFQERVWLFIFESENVPLHEGEWRERFTGAFNEIVEKFSFQLHSFFFQVDTTACEGFLVLFVWNEISPFAIAFVLKFHFSLTLRLFNPVRDDFIWLDFELRNNCTKECCNFINSENMYFFIQNFKTPLFW